MSKHAFSNMLNEGINQQAIEKMVNELVSKGITPDRVKGRDEVKFTNPSLSNHQRIIVASCGTARPEQ